MRTARRRRSRRGHISLGGHHHCPQGRSGELSSFRWWSTMHARGVTHVTRGRDLFAATDLQRLLRAFDLPEPLYSHHRVICWADGRNYRNQIRIWDCASCGTKARRPPISERSLAWRDRHLIQSRIYWVSSFYRGLLIEPGNWPLSRGLFIGQLSREKWEIKSARQRKACKAALS